MYVDPYERFVHKPIERKPAAPSLVPYARVGRHPPSVFEEPPKRKLKRRELWPQIAELYAQYPTKPLSFLARRVGLHHTSVHYALKTMGLYVRRNSDEHVQKRLAFRKLPGYVSQKRQARERARAIRAAGKHWNWKLKLDSDQVRAIRHMRTEGISAVDIAQKFGIGESTVRGIVRRASWKHVP